MSENEDFRIAECVIDESGEAESYCMDECKGFDEDDFEYATCIDKCILEYCIKRVTKP